MGISYAIEKYMVAVDSLAAGLLSLQQRLESAALSMYTLRREDFPHEDLWKRHRSIFDDLTWVQETREGEGTIQATTRQLMDHDAQEIARRIFSLFLSLRELNPLE
jgi:hypothetical protein